ncbi:triphosphoribosyl-dephospho-CoA synthase CitG [Orbaceae bacterium ac157xtp]
MDYYTKQKKVIDSQLKEAYLKHFSSQLAQQALLKEVCLSPKPGLVDMLNNGAHKDMNFDTFIASIKAISPWFDLFYDYGKNFNLSQNGEFLQGLRVIGLKCEQAMFDATKRVNTHKGGIFAFGLLLGALGKLTQKNASLNYLAICDEISNQCQGLVVNELVSKNSANTVGEKLFKQYQLTGARGEAESGYKTVRDISLPIFNEMLSKGFDEETSLLQAMLYLLAYNKDTNIVSRGGISGLEFVQESAKTLIKKGGILDKNGRDDLQKLDLELIRRNISPGGSADLIAITWFLSQFQ